MIRKTAAAREAVREIREAHFSSSLILHPSKIPLDAAL
jgi:hypothetical protein